jgi:hypothetical protein
MGSKIELGSCTMKVEQTRQRIREMLAIWEAVISTNLTEAHTHYTEMEPLWIHLWSEMEDDIKAKQENRKAHMK